LVFAGDRVLQLRNRGYDFLAAGTGLEVESTIDQPVERLVAASETSMSLYVGGEVLLYATGPPPDRRDRVYLGDSHRARSADGAEYVRGIGALLFYLHSDGTLRVFDLDSAFKTPATLTEPGGAVVAFDYLPGSGPEGAMVVVASRRGVSIYDLSRPDVVHRIGRVELAVLPLAVIGRAVVGEKGVAVVGIDGGAVKVERAIDLEVDEIEATSAHGRAGELVVPDLTEVKWRESVGPSVWDPAANHWVERVDRWRDSARLAGVRVVDLATGEVLAVQLPDSPRLNLRLGGLNRSLVFAPLPDGRVVYARPDGALYLSAW
jgi:hypothetical protein